MKKTRKSYSSNPKLKALFFNNVNILKQKVKVYKQCRWKLESQLNIEHKALTCKYCNRVFHKRFGVEAHKAMVHPNEVEKEHRRKASERYKYDVRDDSDDDMIPEYDSDDDLIDWEAYRIRPTKEQIELIELSSDDDDDDDETRNKDVITFDKSTWKLLIRMGEFRPKVVLLDFKKEDGNDSTSEEEEDEEDQVQNITSNSSNNCYNSQSILVNNAELLDILEKDSEYTCWVQIINYKTRGLKPIIEDTYSVKIMDEELSHSDNGHISSLFEEKDPLALLDINSSPSSPISSPPHIYIISSSPIKPSSPLKNSFSQKNKKYKLQVPTELENIIIDHDDDNY